MFNDFSGSFDAFIEAFRWGPKSKPLKANFDVMMTHFHGPDKDLHNDVVRARMSRLAEEDAEKEEQRRQMRILAQQRLAAVVRIQVAHTALVVLSLLQSLPPIWLNPCCAVLCCVQKLWRRFSGQRRFDRSHKELKERVAARIAAAKAGRGRGQGRDLTQTQSPPPSRSATGQGRINSRPTSRAVSSRGRSTGRSGKG